jgi:hypothetical protein
MHATIAGKREDLAALCRRFGVTRLDLFGSAARGTDIDRLLTPEQFGELTALFYLSRNCWYSEYFYAYATRSTSEYSVEERPSTHFSWNVSRDSRSG